MSENEPATTKLRAEAPSFCPSNRTTIETGRTHNVDGNDSSPAARLPYNKNSVNRKNRSNRRKHQHQHQHQHVWKKSSNKSMGDDVLRGGPVIDPAEKNGDGEGKESSKISSKNRNSGNKKEKKVPRNKRGNQQRGAFHGNANNKKKNRGRSECQQTDAREQLLENEKVVLPLHEESAFPSLGPLPESLGIATAENTFSSIWHNPQAKNNLLYTPPMPSDPKGSPYETRDDDFAALGLEKLSSAVARARKSELQSQYSSWNDDDDDDDDDSSDSEHSSVSQNAARTGGIHIQTTSTSSELPTQQLQERGVQNRRPQWNMNKLRDKWWDALERRRTKRNFMIELQERLRDRIVDPDFFDFSSSDEAANYVTASKPMASSDDCQSINEPGPSSLESILMDHPCQLHVDSSRDEIIDRIIQEGDFAALNELLELWPKSDGDSVTYPPDIMQRIVKVDLPELLNVMLTRLNTFDPSSENSGASDCSTDVAGAFMLAAELGHEGCLSVFLTRWDNSTALFTSKDDAGNSVFHHCCRGQGSALVLQILLRHISGGTKSKQQQLSKVLLSRNKSSQTALHVACERARVDFVEIFLSVCSTALLAKILAMEDDRLQTPLLAAVGANASDVVMCLIMWRGNRNLILRKTPQAPEKRSGGSSAGKEPQLPPCPMAWAAKHGNLDMIQLLLQFSDPSGKDYRVTESIAALLLSDATSDIKTEGCQLLVRDGGNPFSEIIAYDGILSDTAISIAAQRCNTYVLHALVSTGLQQLGDRQQRRRKDPKLRQQPESFFRGIESKEDFEKERALSNALVESLYRGWEESEKDDEGLPQSLASAVSLYMLGAELKGKDRARLHVSIKARQLKPIGLFAEEPNPHCFVASYVRQAGVASKMSTKISELDRSRLSLRSSLLLEMEWFQEELRTSSCSCPWVSDGYTDSSFRYKPRWKDDEVTLIADDGTAFTVHESIVSSKSAKLASALRFATMKKSSHSTSSPDMKRILHLNIPPQYCAWMLQHIYHGSIACGWSRGREQDCCHEILELMLVAEEFLCYSLLQECEMRLLNVNPTECFCWSCARSVRCHSETDKSAECLYFSRGPSRLLTGATVLDVLAVLQDLGDMDFKYQVSRVNRSASWLKSASPIHLWNQEDASGWSSHAATRSLKDAAIITILSSFPEVVKSGSFQENANWNDARVDNEDYDETHSSPTEILVSRALLLQMCLEELSASELPKAYERYHNAPKSSSRTSCN